MTVCIGMTFGTYALLGADTRVSKRLPFGVRYHDDQEKIQYTSLGLITGAGLVQLLDRVKDTVRDTEIRHTDELVEVAEEAYDLIRDQFAGWKELEDWLRLTAWLVTYRAEVDNQTTVRLGVLRKAGDRSRAKLDILEPHQAICLVPPEAAEINDEIHQSISAALRPLDSFDSIQEHVDYHRFVLTKYIAEFAIEFDSVSEAMHFAVHTESGQREISERTDLSEICEKIREGYSTDDGSGLL